MRPKLTLGVLGGMGPAATADFMRLMAQKAPAGCDQEHPEMFIYSNTITHTCLARDQTLAQI